MRGQGTAERDRGPRMTTTRPTVLNRQSLAEQVAGALVELIRSEGLAEGDSIPPAAELAQRFGVSRTVIREALAALAGQGILQRGQGRDSVVTLPGPPELANLLQFQIRETADERHVIALRMALEVSAAEEAARHRTDEHVALLHAHLLDLETARDDRRFHRADLALHRAVAAASGNPLVTLILDALSPLLHDVRTRSLRNRRARGDELGPVIDQHRAVVAAIEAADPGAAASAMRQHLAATAAEFDADHL